MASASAAITRCNWTGRRTSLLWKKNEKTVTNCENVWTNYIALTTLFVKNLCSHLVSCHGIQSPVSVWNRTVSRTSRSGKFEDDDQSRSRSRWWSAADLICLRKNVATAHKNWSLKLTSPLFLHELPKDQWHHQGTTVKEIKQQNRQSE